MKIKAGDIYAHKDATDIEWTAVKDHDLVNAVLIRSKKHETMLRQIAKICKSYDSSINWTTQEQWETAKMVAENMYFCTPEEYVEATYYAIFEEEKNK